MGVSTRGAVATGPRLRGAVRLSLWLWERGNVAVSATFPRFHSAGTAAAWFHLRLGGRRSGRRISHIRGTRFAPSAEITHPKPGRAAGKRRRYRCIGCGQTFSTTKGTPYYRLQHRRATFDSVVTLRVEGVSLSAIARIERLAWNTVARWLERAAAVCRHCSHGRTTGRAPKSPTRNPEEPPGNGVATGASGADRRSRRRKARPITASSIAERRSTVSSRCASRGSVCRRLPGSNGWPGTPSPAGSSGLPPCVATVATAGPPAERRNHPPETRKSRRETASLPVHRVRTDVLDDERHALLPPPASPSDVRQCRHAARRGGQSVGDCPDRTAGLEHRRPLARAGCRRVSPL